MKAMSVNDGGPVSEPSSQKLTDQQVMFELGSDRTNDDTPNIFYSIPQIAPEIYMKNNLSQETFSARDNSGPSSTSTRRFRNIFNNNRSKSPAQIEIINNDQIITDRKMIKVKSEQKIQIITANKNRNTYDAQPTFGSMQNSSMNKQTSKTNPSFQMSHVLTEIDSQQDPRKKQGRVIRITPN